MIAVSWGFRKVYVLKANFSKNLLQITESHKLPSNCELAQSILRRKFPSVYIPQGFFLEFYGTLTKFSRRLTTIHLPTFSGSNAWDFRLARIAIIENVPATFLGFPTIFRSFLNFTENSRRCSDDLWELSQLKMVFSVTSSNCKVKIARFYEFFFTLGWR